jgi:hypothetical protein
MLNTIIGSVCITPIIFIRDALLLCFPRNRKYDLCGIARITIHSVGYILWTLLLENEKELPYYYCCVS